MRFTIETITPERARQILDDCGGDNYRKVDPKTVRKYALDMAHHNWPVTGESLKFSPMPEGGERLSDGQHRLLACIAANEPFTTAIAHDVPAESAEFMDWGKKRGLNDVLKHRGETHTAELSGVINLGWRWEADQIFASSGPSLPDALDFLRRHPGVREATKVARNNYRQIKVPPSALGIFIYRTTLLSPEDEVAFRHVLLNGSGLEEGDPVYAFRRWLFQGSGADERRRPDQVVFLAMLIKTWNNRLLGRNTRSVFWRARVEPFPTLVAPQRQEEAVS